MLFLTQFGQADPVDALVTCAAAPSTCTTFSTVLVNLASKDVPVDRRVLELIQSAMARGSEGGTNPFFAAPIAVDVVRIHADADPDFAAQVLMQAIDTVARDTATAQRSQGKDGFFAHALDGIQARLQFRTEAPPADLRRDAVALLQKLAATASLPDTAQRAGAILKDLGETVLVPPVVTATPPTTSVSHARVAGMALGVGLAVIVTVSLLIGASRAPEHRPTLARRRRRV
jgi:hypothetical protein